MPLSAKTSDPRFLPCHLLYEHIISKSETSVGAMKYIPLWTNFLFLNEVLSILSLLRQRPTSANLSSAALNFWPSRIVLSAIYCFQSGLFDARSLIPVTQWSIRRSNSSVLAPCLLLILMDWEISQTQSLTLLSFCRVVKPPFSCWIPMVSAAHWMTPTSVFLAQTRTCTVGIGIVLASGTADFGNQKASHYILVLNCGECFSCRYQMVVTPNLNRECSIYRQRWCGVVVEVRWVCWKVSRFSVRWAGKANIYMGLKGFSWSGDIILAAIQLGNMLLSNI